MAATHKRWSLDQIMGRLVAAAPAIILALSIGLVGVVAATSVGNTRTASENKCHAAVAEQMGVEVESVNQSATVRTDTGYVINGLVFHDGDQIDSYVCTTVGHWKSYAVDVQFL